MGFETISSFKLVGDLTVGIFIGLEEDLKAVIAESIVLGAI